MATQTEYIVSLRGFDSNGNPTNGGYATGNAATYITSATMTSSLPAASPTGSYTNSGSSTATTWAQSVIKQANGGPILIFIHGYDNTANNVVQKHAILDYALGNPIDGLFGSNPYCLVSLDWPTQGGDPGGTKTAYVQSQNYAVTAGPLLVSTCLQVLVNAGALPGQLNILTHSMGGLVVQCALASANNPPVVNQVLMAEADVYQTAFDVSYTPPTNPAPPAFPPPSLQQAVPNSPNPDFPVVATFLSFCTGLTVYCSSQDQALGQAPNTDGTTRLGHAGLPTDTLNAYPSQCNNVDYTTYYEDTYVNGVSPAPFGSATHVWPLISTQQVPNSPKPYTAVNPCAPDPHFIQDVYEVLTGAKTFTERTQGSPSNNWTFTT